MSMDERQNKLTSEFKKGIARSKCRKCGCMKGALKEIQKFLSHEQRADAEIIRKKVDTWLSRTEENLYT